MDIIDHLIFTATNTLRSIAPINSPFLVAPIGSTSAPASLSDNYTQLEKENFILCQDTSFIEAAIQKHWFDLTNGPVNFPAYGDFFRPSEAPPYHMIYSYLIENTRIVQIMERLIQLYQEDELLGIAGPGVPANQKAFQWIVNTENLFFKDLPNHSYRNIAGHVRPNSESNRRNAYFRLFGMGLAFGDSQNSKSSSQLFNKAQASNVQFVPLFEQFLIEIWQAYINARNSSGANSTDYQRLIDLTKKLRQMLMARRGVGANGFINLGDYRFMNLSKEEYSSFVMMSWFFYIISYNTSPLVLFLGCQANTAAERLQKIGKKVNIEAHTQSQGLIDMAGPMHTILRMIETGTFEIEQPNVWVRLTIESQSPNPSPSTTPQQRAALIDLLTIINNWEKTTGHKIKNPELINNGHARIEHRTIRLDGSPLRAALPEN